LSIIKIMKMCEDVRTCRSDCLRLGREDMGLADLARNGCVAEAQNKKQKERERMVRKGKV